MQNYYSVIYPKTKTSYPIKLCSYLVEKVVVPGKRTKRLLDIGCGNGIFTKMFEKVGNVYAYGVDCRQSLSNRFEKRDIETETLSFDTEMFDVVFSKSVIEHLHSPDNMIKEAMRVLKTGGKIIIMTPDWKSQINHFWDDHTHCHPYTRKSLMNLLKIYGYKNVTCVEFYQLPFIWKHKWLEFVPMLISLLPDCLKWKDGDMQNGKDRKLIRFSKEKMLLAIGTK